VRARVRVYVTLGTTSPLSKGGGGGGASATTTALGGGRPILLLTACALRSKTTALGIWSLLLLFFGILRGGVFQHYNLYYIIIIV